MDFYGLLRLYVATPGGERVSGAVFEAEDRYGRKTRQTAGRDGSAVFYLSPTLDYEIIVAKPPPGYVSHRRVICVKCERDGMVYAENALRSEVGFTVTRIVKPGDK